MGIYDRDYMRERTRAEDGPAVEPARQPVAAARWWQRLLFRLWLLLHPKRSKGN